MSTFSLFLMMLPVITSNGTAVRFLKALVAGLALQAMFVSGKVAKADALVVTRAMSASTIAEVFVEPGRVRVELEIGPSDWIAFQNCLPGPVFSELTGLTVSRNQRVQAFFEEDFVIAADGQRLGGRIDEFTPAVRLVRDEVTGDPLPVQPDEVDRVLKVTLVYESTGRPDVLVIKPPTDEGITRASIGFVCYHNGLAVNDFRYLPASATLDLDWEDPWYSRFRHPNLWRQFDAPLSAYLYVEPHEIRKEIVLRPFDFKSQIGFDFSDDRVIPVKQQEALKRKVVEFLGELNPVTIDGREARGELDRVHFVRRTLRSTGVIEPPEDLDLNSATLGVIYIYPIDRLPEKVEMACEMFTPRIQSIPCVASDEAGGLPSTVTPEDPVLVWKNYLVHPTSSDMLAVAAPPPTPTLTVSVLAVTLFVASLVLVVLAWRRERGPVPKTVVFCVAGILFVIGLFASRSEMGAVEIPIRAPDRLTEKQAKEILTGLLYNTYRSFDHHDEKVIYDRLAQSVAGDLLSEVYLSTREEMEVKNQGGLQVSVKQVEIAELHSVDSDQRSPTFRCDWRVGGWIGHWGHLHARENHHVAEITLADREGVWKIVAMKKLDPTDSSESGSVDEVDDAERGNDTT